MHSRSGVVIVCGEQVGFISFMIVIVLRQLSVSSLLKESLILLVDPLLGIFLGLSYITEV